MTLNTEINWDAKSDVFRSTSDFSDLLKIVSAYYDMYSKIADFIGPWIAKQRGMIFLSPEKEQLKTILGKDRPSISFRAKSAFLDSLIYFLDKHKGHKTLITPNPSTHHSAQFPEGTFEVKEVKQQVFARVGKNIKPLTGKIYEIYFAGAEFPVYVQNPRIPLEQVKFIILRPKMGKLGTANVSKWEVLLYRRKINYIVDHVDSNVNPRFSGII